MVAGGSSCCISIMLRGGLGLRLGLGPDPKEWDGVLIKTL